MKCQLANLAVHYEIIGEGKPFLTISGIPSDHHIVMSWMEPIFESRAGWQRIYFDLPGTGLTPSGGIKTIEGVLDVVCEFIDYLLPSQTFTLFGLSVGGYLARGVVHRKADQVNGLCLLVPWMNEHADGDLPQPVVITRDPKVIEQLSPDDIQKVESLAVVQNQKVVDWYRSAVLPARQHGGGLAIEKFTFPFNPEDVSKPFEKPTLILTGRQDSHVGYREAFEIVESYPRATLAVLDRSGHALGVEQEKLFHALVNEWLDRVEEDAQSIEK